MTYYCKIFIGYDEIQFTLQNSETADLIFVIHRSIAGARKFVMEHLELHSAEMIKMGKIHFEGRLEDWNVIKDEIANRLRYF